MAKMIIEITGMSKDFLQTTVGNQLEMVFKKLPKVKSGFNQLKISYED